MYTRIGRKIQIIAIVLGVCMALLSVAIGICMMVIPEFGNEIAGLFTIILGPAASWIVSLLFFGFGIITENSERQLSESWERDNAENEKAKQRRETVEYTLSE